MPKTSTIDDPIPKIKPEVGDTPEKFTDDSDRIDDFDQRIPN